MAGANAHGARGPFPKVSKPLIGAVNGVAVTGGLELALNCDFLVASEHAKFGDTHARVGVMPGWGMTVLLPQAIGVRRAREMSFTGNFLGAEEALQFGLVNHVVPHEELLPFTRALAADIVGNEADAVRQIRATYAAIAHDDDAWEKEARDSRAWQRTMFSAERWPNGGPRSSAAAGRSDRRTAARPLAAAEAGRPALERRTVAVGGLASASSSRRRRRRRSPCTATGTPRATTSPSTSARRAACSTATSPRSSPTTASPSSTRAGAFSPIAYPWGWPLLLSPFVHLWGSTTTG